MPDLSELGDLLIRWRVVARTQWGEAAAAGGDDLDAVLDAVAAGPPPWWDRKPPAPPGLTEYQRNVIETRFADDELDILPRNLAVNQFVLLDRLGRGGQGEVYRARQLSPGRFVAVKTLVKDTDSSRERFEREARTLMRIRHPAIARFYLYERVRDGWGEPTDEYVIAMEFVNGSDASRVVRRAGPVPWGFAARWAADLLGGLAVIHDAGFVHRDVKPENVMVVGPDPGPGVAPDDTAAKLLDFGAVKEVGTGVDEAAVADKMFFGTPEYAAPEQWQGQLVPASDLYALGGTLFYLLTKRTPFQKDRRDVRAYMKSHLRDAAPDVRELNPAVPPELGRLITRMLAKSPEERGTAADLVGEFQWVLQVEPEPARTPPPTSHPTRPAPTPARLPAPPARRPAPDHESTGIGGSVLGLLERIFIPGHVPAPGGATVPERVASLLRRPLVLVVLAVLLALAVWLVV